jgi:DNA-nicking Smr family endonuclease
MAKPSGPGHRPFQVLRDLVARGELALAPTEEKPVTPPENLAPVLSDEEAFVAGMRDVRPLGWSATPLALPAPIPRASREDRSDDEAESLRALHDFIAGRGEMDPFATGEGVEGASSREGRRYLARLKRGDFSVQGHLDLHGYGLADARDLLERFLRQSQYQGYCCVRVVHGRGTHSESEPGLMKRAVTRWLSSRRLSQTVVAFASARWKDGGSGAVYVLLSRKRPPRRR